MYTYRRLGVGRSREELGQGCGSIVPNGDDEGRLEGRTPAGNNVVVGGGDEETRRRRNPGGGQDSSGEGAVWAEEDVNRSGMVVREEANVGHNSGGGGQRKRTVGKEGARGENSGETEEVRDRGGQLLLMATKREGRAPAGGSAAPVVEMRKPGSDGTREEDETAVMRAWSRWRRTAMGQGSWSEWKDLVGHSCRAKGRGWSREEEARGENSGEIGEVREGEGVNCS